MFSLKKQFDSELICEPTAGPGGANFNLKDYFSFYKHVFVNISIPVIFTDHSNAGRNIIIFLLEVLQAAVKELQIAAAANELILLK